MGHRGTTCASANLSLDCSTALEVIDEAAGVNHISGWRCCGCVLAGARSRARSEQATAGRMARIRHNRGCRNVGGFLRKGLEELGYVVGRDIELLVRMAENRAERLPGLAEEIVALDPAVIVAGAVDAALVAKKATSSIPIVSGALADADHWA